MLWNKTLSPDSCRAEFASLVQSGVTPAAAYDHVADQINEVLADLNDNDLDVDDVSALMEWWCCDVDYREIAV